MITLCCLYYRAMYNQYLDLIMLGTVQMQVEKWQLSQKKQQNKLHKRTNNMNVPNKEQLKESKRSQRIFFCLPHMYAIELEGEKYFDFSGTLMFQQFEIVCKKGLERELLDAGVLAMAGAVILVSLNSTVTTTLCCACYLPWTGGTVSPRVLNFQAISLAIFVETVGAGSPGPHETTSWTAQKLRLA